MKTRKKQTLGTWISLVAVLITVIGLVVYNMALQSGMGLAIANGSQPFYEMGRDEDAVMMTMVIPCAVIAMGLLVVAIILGQVRVRGAFSKIINVISGIMRIAAPALILTTLLYFLYGSFTGLGWTFFSNAELEIYPQAISTGITAIAGLACFAVAGLASIIASFFDVVKEVRK